MKNNPLSKADRDPSIITGSEGEPATHPQADAESWHSFPGETGTQTPKVHPEDEDDEGRSESARLVEEGVDRAEEDQMRRASRSATRDGSL
ncbi:hypothetical protein SAMN05444156_1079 [Verrucomicrobium sp. GAS474]|uniref:hypothetical protein n=1 Tax=Verrucomicrobium sp. GAS474 TaxID=1882831 RepID=UPI00087D4975|nr:hypothetical protein [Verrucomicrobium sp. GAS474]SDT96035.1 hypothetical protein SAMN05444156_1079 [Verrucomicrobium sp. GAS474]